jgi:predicted peptidase
MPVYSTATGTTVSTPHVVASTVALTAGIPRTATVTLSGSAVFTNGTSYVCTAQNATNTADRVQLAITNGTTFVVTSQNNSNITVAYICIGN